MTAPLAWNINQAMRAGLALIRKGHYPMVPHLSQHMADYASVCDRPEPSYERWMALDFAWLSRADAILYLAPSPGADRELAFARERGLRVFLSVDDVPEVIAS